MYSEEQVADADNKSTDGNFAANRKGFSALQIRKRRCSG
jgi:hypothetical protein